MADVVRVATKVKVPTLHKSKVKVPNFDSELRTLAVNAKNKLGYRVLHEVVNGSIELASVLRHLHIRAFKPDLIEDYKKKKLREQTLKLRRENPRTRFATLGWNETNLANYEKPIPEFVLNKAMQIKDALPQTEFYIEELTENAPDPDPFIIAVHGKERYYFEVWEEPGFEAEVLKGRVYINNDSSDASDEDDR